MTASANNVTQDVRRSSLVGLFLNDQYIKGIAKKASKSASKDTQRAAVLGAGIMGGGIAYQSALKGVPVLMKDIAQAQYPLASVSRKYDSH